MNNDNHGADIYGASKNYGMDEDDIIDFSSNINPFGIPDNVQEAIISSIKYSNRYPDINSRELIKGLSNYEKIPESWIFCSSGAAEAIFRIALCFIPQNAILISPTFSEYEQALETVGTGIKYFTLEEKNGFKLTDRIIDDIKIDTNIVFICNPNNPTGQITDKTLLEKIIAHCKLMNTTIVIDECFMDFVEDKEKYSIIDLLEKYNNLIVLKAFTKIYAIPGIRLGYCMSSNENIISFLKKSGPPWNVSTIAQAAGVASLKEIDYVAKSVQYVKKQRKYLTDEMKKLNINIYESHANYIFFRLKKNIDLYDELLKKGILVRNCSNYRNLDDSYYRIAVKSEYENNILIDNLKEIIGSK
jgi:L-threonine-O-3-phosphate decarboxylase